MRSELLSLSRDMADTVARHLVAAGQIIDEDSELALQHAIAARRIASRIAVVREAVGLAAYAAGDWATAIAELRTYHRMSGKQTHLAEIADSERALGRPERAIDLFRGADREALDKAGAIELLIVAAGARGDLGQHEAAVAMLQVRELTLDEESDWAARLRYAYADALLAAGRRDEAREWFVRAEAADTDDLTDAAERLLELDGVTIEGDDEDDESADRDDEATASAGEDDEDVATASTGEDDDEDDERDDDGSVVSAARDESDGERDEDDLDEDVATGIVGAPAEDALAGTPAAAADFEETGDVTRVPAATFSDGVADDERDKAQFQGDAFVDDDESDDEDRGTEADVEDAPAAAPADRLIADVDAGDEPTDTEPDEKAAGDEFRAERRPEA